jgi:uncharacterized protein YjbI with pentapeptide repeats
VDQAGQSRGRSAERQPPWVNVERALDALLSWRPTRRQLERAGVVAALTFSIIVICGYLFGWKWTGLVADAEYPNRTLWDWLDLLIVPIVLAIGGYLFNSSQNRRAQEIADQDRQDESLQSYLDNILDMLSDPDQPLHRSWPGDSLSVVARARTLPLLRRLDMGRKRIVVQFLYESGLIAKDRLVVDLDRANLTNAGLNELHLKGAHLNGVFLVEASLNGVLLEGASLRRVWMQRANLRVANLVGADLRGAFLSGADLRGADLSRADLRREPDLEEEVDLEGADLSAANLRGARLQGAYLREAILHPSALDPPEDPSSVEAFLYEQYFRDADLRDADLTGADLTGALITTQQLAAAQSLRGATMPNGQKYEDWLKDE